MAAPASATLTVLGLPPLAKAFDPAAIATGGTSTLTVTIGNANLTEIALTGIFTDTFPAGMTVADPVDTAGTTCLGVAATAGGSNFTIADETTIPAGGCVVKVKVTSSTVGAAINTTGSLQTSAGTAAPAAATLTVMSPPTLAKSFDPPTIAPGGTSTLTVTIANANGSAITLSGTFTDAFPAGMTVASPADTTGTTCAGVTATAGAASFSIASGTSIPAGGCVVKVKVTTSASGPSVNTTGSLQTSAGTAAPATATLTAVGPIAALGIPTLNSLALIALMLALALGGAMHARRLRRF